MRVEVFCIRIPSIVLFCSGVREVGDQKRGNMSSHHSSTNDPRQPSTAKPYVPPTIAQDAPFDVSGFLALIFAVTGLLFRYKANLWLALICCAKSLVNMKNIENDFKQISMAMMFSIMGLVTYYFQPYRSVAPQS